MATYAGNWKDVNGVPFSPEGSVITTQPGGGDARQTRQRPRSSAPRRRMAEINGYLRKIWFDELTAAERALWQYVGPASPPARGKNVPGYYGSNWHGFTAFTYADVYRKRETSIRGPRGSYSDFYNAWITTANSGTQWLYLHWTYGSWFGSDPSSAVIAYMVNPKDVRSSVYYKETRIATMHWVFNPIGGQDDYIVEAPFRFNAGDLVKMYFRARHGFTWWWWLPNEVTAI